MRLQLNILPLTSGKPFVQFTHFAKWITANSGKEGAAAHRTVNSPLFKMLSAAKTRGVLFGYPKMVNNLGEQIVSASIVWTYPTSIDEMWTETFDDKKVKGATIAVIDFDSIDFPQATKYLVARKFKEKYDYVVGKCSVLYEDYEWYSNADKIDFRSFEILDRGKRVVYYGPDIAPEDKIECIEEEWIDRVDSIALTYHLNVNGEISEQILKLDRYIDAYSVRLEKLVYLTTIAEGEESIKDAVNILLEVLFDLDCFDYDRDEIEEVVNPRFYFIGEAVSWLKDFFGDEDGAVEILVRSGIEDNCLRTCVPKGMSVTIVLSNEKADIKLDHLPFEL